MWPFDKRCQHNKLSQGADSGYRCDRDAKHLGAHTCTVNLKVHKWWTCVGCGLAALTNSRLCEDCQKDEK